MKNNIMMFVIGLLVGAILTTGVFMLINKNNPRPGDFRMNNIGPGGPMTRGTPPTQEEMDAMQKTMLEDGTIMYQSPDGGAVMMQKRIDGQGEGSGGGMMRVDQ